MDGRENNLTMTLNIGRPRGVGPIGGILVSDLVMLQRTLKENGENEGFVGRTTLSLIEVGRLFSR